MKFTFEPLNLKPEGTWLQRVLKSKETQKTLIFVLLGSVAGFVYFYFTQGQSMDVMPAKEIIKSMAIGGFFGFFITNSPCARGRC